MHIQSFVLAPNSATFDFVPLARDPQNARVTVLGLFAKGVCGLNCPACRVCGRPVWCFHVFKMSSTSGNSDSGQSSASFFAELGGGGAIGGAPDAARACGCLAPYPDQATVLTTKRGFLSAGAGLGGGKRRKSSVWHR